MSNSETNGGTMIGKVISDKMQKTIVVVVERTVKHPLSMEKSREEELNCMLMMKTKSVKLEIP